MDGRLITDDEDADDNAYYKAVVEHKHTIAFTKASL